MWERRELDFGPQQIKERRGRTTVLLSRIATARSGDKGEGSNVGVMARSDVAYAFLKDFLSEEVVRRHMAGINAGSVVRYAADNMRVLNFLLTDSLGGGGSASLRTDAPCPRFSLERGA